MFDRLPEFIKLNKKEFKMYTSRIDAIKEMFNSVQKFNLDDLPILWFIRSKNVNIVKKNLNQKVQINIFVVQNVEKFIRFKLDARDIVILCQR